MANKQQKTVNNRPKVTGVTLNISYPDGSTKTVTVDAWRVEGIFWSDRAVIEMLAPFYDKTERTATYEELAERFGESRLHTLVQKSGEIRITPKLIESIWNTPGDNGHLPPVVMKTRKCIPTIGHDF